MDELDLASLEDCSSEYLDAAHRKRLGDMAWRVHFRKGRAAGGGKPGLLVLVEFQSDVDRRMDERMREYSKMLLDQAAGSRPAGREGARPWVLPIVVYNGSKPWMAAGRATDLTALPSAAAMRGLAFHQPQSYHLLAAGGGLTAGARPAQDWPSENRVSATVRLQAAATPQDLLPRLLQEFARFPGPGNEAFRRALHAWARALWEHKTGGAAGFPAFEKLERTKGAIMTTVAEAAWDRWDARVRAEAFEQGIERGVEQGVEQGLQRQRALLRRLVKLRFGTGVAEQAAQRLERIADANRLEEVGELILRCETGGELLTRMDA